jgi:hypothetical protein
MFAVGCPRVRFWEKVMVDVDGAQLQRRVFAAELTKTVKQGRGIDAAAEGNAAARASGLR